ncbi:longevity assurance protein [Tritrichomonas foetus]|uniref:Longevity assurance protein n=1 Tax=Tritrichomonas foetus TaxID=1144522 RepID=A0A1J4JAX4_9EUKA|nr:longevity assurance protein [Tritrichomonas foetus]|eukprot:OHS95383.1 longevity assurance protein [Tritrichomonas foetus]
MQFNFEELRSMTTISTSDIPFFLGFCGMMAVFRYVIMHFFLERLAIIFKQKNPTKFKNRSYDLIHYTTSAILGLISMTTVNYGKCFFYAKDCLEPFQQQDAFVCTVIEKIYYFVFLSYYVVDYFYIYTSPEILVLAIHHFSTISMVLLMVAIRMPAMGFAIMILHDVVDVPLYLGKVLYYLGSKVLKDISMAVFAISCTYFRIFNLLIIVYQTWILERDEMNEFRPGWSRIAFWLLRVLYCLHLFWEWKIVKAVVAIIQGSGEIKDTRSD